MLQLKNNTPFAAGLALFADKDGIDTLYVMASATFNIGKKWTLADVQTPPRGADEYWGEDPLTSSLKYPSDFHIGKPATDIAMLGHARPPQGKPVSQLDVSLRVGRVSKTVRVFGEREWQGGSISRPKPFESMPLVYERAFGGMHVHEGQIISAELRNLLGCGYLGKQKARVLDGLAVPNLEDPRQLLHSAGDVVTPAGFGFISPNWQPRVSYAGTYDEQWQTRRAPYLPEDFDQRFLNMAHPDLIYPGFLQGGEPVQISGVHPQGDLQFMLPVIGLSARVMIANRVETPQFNLETLVIEPDELKLSLSWKAAVPCDKSALKIKDVILNLAQQRQQAA